MAKKKSAGEGEDVDFQGQSAGPKQKGSHNKKALEEEPSFSNEDGPGPARGDGARKRTQGEEDGIEDAGDKRIDNGRLLGFLEAGSRNDVNNMRVIPQIHKILKVK